MVYFDWISVDEQDEPLGQRWAWEGSGAKLKKSRVGTKEFREMDTALRTKQKPKRRKK